LKMLHQAAPVLSVSEIRSVACQGLRQETQTLL
jgi:hypothetical protein